MCVFRRMTRESTQQPAAVADVRPVGGMGRADWLELGAWFLLSRLFIVAVAAVSLGRVVPGEYWIPVEGPLDWFFRWDAAWYLDVAQNGYHFLREGEPSNVVFLPLFPWLMRLVSLGGLIPLPVAGYVAANGCLLGAAVWLRRLVRREGGGGATVRWAWAALFLGPVSFFFSTVYAESLFLMLSIGALCLAREQRWWWAGLLGALAALTRFVGFVLVVPLVWEFLTVHWAERARWRLRDVVKLVPVLLPVAGIVAYAVLMWIQLGDPLMYFRGQSHWDRHFSRWWILFARESFWGQDLFFRVWFPATVLGAFGLLLLGVKLRLRPTYLIYGLVFSFIYISARYVEALPRYFSVVAAFYLIVGVGARRWAAFRWPVLVVSTALLALSVVLFVNGYWFT